LREFGVLTAPASVALRPCLPGIDSRCTRRVNTRQDSARVWVKGEVITKIVCWHNRSNLGSTPHSSHPHSPVMRRSRINQSGYQALVVLPGCSQINFKLRWFRRGRGWSADSVLGLSLDQGPLSQMIEPALCITLVVMWMEGTGTGNVPLGIRS
jgi:hypothetical protein